MDAISSLPHDVASTSAIVHVTASGRVPFPCSCTRRWCNSETALGFRPSAVGRALTSLSRSPAYVRSTESLQQIPKAVSCGSLTALPSTVIVCRTFPSERTPLSFIAWRVRPHAWLLERSRRRRERAPPEDFILIAGAKRRRCQGTQFAVQCFGTAWLPESGGGPKL